MSTPGDDIPDDLESLDTLAIVTVMYDTDDQLVVDTDLDTDVAIGMLFRAMRELADSASKE